MIQPLTCQDGARFCVIIMKEPYTQFLRCVDVWEAAGHLGMSPKILMDVYAKHSPDHQKRAADV
jgi:hypothetical protein